MRSLATVYARPPACADIYDRPVNGPTHGKDVRLGHIADIDKVPHLLARAEDHRGTILEQAVYEYGYDADVRRQRLPGPIGVKIPEDYSLEAVISRELPYVHLGSELSGAVRRDGLEYAFFGHREARPVPVDRHRGGEDELFYPCLSRFPEDIDSPEDVRLGVANDIIERVPYADPRGVVKDYVYAVQGLLSPTLSSMTVVEFDS
jgi:hypothetical protein